MIYYDFEGLYLGNPWFVDLFAALDGYGGRRVMYIHRVTLYIQLGGGEPDNISDWQRRALSSVETTRTLQDLTLSSTVMGRGVQ